MDGVAGEKKYATAIRTSHKGMVGPDLLFTRIRFTQSFRVDLDSYLFIVYNYYIIRACYLMQAHLPSFSFAASFLSAAL